MQVFGLFVILLTSAGLTFAAADPLNAPPEAEIYVSPVEGEDFLSGRSPDRHGKEGPLATIEGAVRNAGIILHRNPGTSLTIWLRGGVYRPTQTLVLGPEFSGSKPANVTFASFPGERAVISGFQMLQTSKKPNGHIEVSAGDRESGRIYPQLFVNGVRRLRTRIPENGYFTVAEELPPTTASQGRGADRFVYHPGDLHASLADQDIEALIFQSWTATRLRIREIDETSSSVTFTGPTRGLNWWQTISRGKRYFLENVREALGQPSRWHMDGKTRIITYVPAPDEVVTTASFAAPRVETLLRLEGDAATTKPVEYIVFRNIDFEGTGWEAPPQGYKTGQTETSLPAAVELVQTQFCRFEGCRISRTACWGMSLRGGCVGNTITGCDLTDLGAGGIKIGVFGKPPIAREDESHSNGVVNCLIAHGGRVHPAGPGIVVSHAAYTTILRNTITDFYQLAVSIGWSWGYDSSPAHHNIVQGNLLTCLGQDVLSDLGGIYTLGVSDGTCLIGNRIDDVRSFDYGGWGIYFDEGTSGILARDNIVTHAERGGFHEHYGGENIVTNNIFAFNGEEQIIKTRPESHASIRFLGNIVVHNGGNILGGRWEGDGAEFEDNLYWNFAGPVEFGKRDLAARRALGNDTRSIIADPLFVDAIDGDFHLTAGSPAERMGFKDIGDQTYGCDRATPEPMPRMYP